MATMRARIARALCSIGVHHRVPVDVGDRRRPHRECTRCGAHWALYTYLGARAWIRHP